MGGYNSAFLGGLGAGWAASPPGGFAARTASPPGPFGPKKKQKWQKNGKKIAKIAKNRKKMTFLNFFSSKITRKRPFFFIKYRPILENNDGDQNLEGFCPRKTP